jgi:septin family protein
MEKSCENNENDENYKNNENTKMLMKIIYTSEQLQENTNYFIDDVNDIIDVYLTELDKSKFLEKQQELQELQKQQEQELQKQEQELEEIKNKMNSFKSIINENYDFVKIYLRNNLMKMCNHDWIIDHIDSSIYECKRIEYCNKCESTKNDE